MLMTKTRKMVAVKTLKNAKHNPPNRITKENIRSLAMSMDLIGLLQPITVTLDNEIIEGHRRVASAKQLGWEFIEANIVKDADADAIYGSLNTTARKLTGADALYVWLSNPKAVIPSQQKLFEDMVAQLGRPLVKMMCDEGFSRSLYLTSKRIASYCEHDDPDTLRAIVRWLIKFPVSGKIQKAIESGESPRAILKAVKSGKNIQLRIAVG